MRKVYTSAVAIIPPEKKWDPIQEIRKVHDRQINRWMPHITLIYPFRPDFEYPDLEKKFLEASKQIVSFEIVLTNFKYFNHGHQKYTMWLDPEPSELVVNLQAELLKIVPDCNDVNNYNYAFTPHLSVGQFNRRKVLEQKMREFQNSWIPIEYEVKEIYFICRENSKGSKFHIERSIPLRT